MKQLMLSRNRPLALRVLVLLLALIVLAASPLNTFCQAHAIAVVDDAAAGIVALLLVAGGYTFANRDTLTECAWNLWQGMSGELKSGILSVATIWAENQGQVNIWKVSASLKDMFLDYLGNWYSIDAQSFVNVHTDQLSEATYVWPTGMSEASFLNNILVSVIPPDIFYYRDLSTNEVHNVQIIDDNSTISMLLDGVVTYSFQPFSAGQVGNIVLMGWFFALRGVDPHGDAAIYFNYSYQLSDSTTIKYGVKTFLDSDRHEIRCLSESYLASFDAYAQQIYDFPVTVPDAALQDFKDLPDEPVLQLPATTNITNIYNTTYADVTSPSYQLDQSEIAALPADVPTIRTDTGTGEGTDTPETPVVPALPTAPSFIDGLTLPTTSWTEKFPFSIPFDAVRIFSQLQVEPIKPVFVIPYKYGSIVDEQITIDLSKFEVLFAAIKWLTYVVFLLGLMQVTRNWIKW